MRALWPSCPATGGPHTSHDSSSRRFPSMGVGQHSLVPPQLDQRGVRGDGGGQLGKSGAGASSPPWPHVTSHGVHKGTMTALIRSDVHQSVASKRVLHHQGDSSWVPYVYDDPNSLQHVVRGLYNSGKAPAVSAFAASMRHPVGRTPPPWGGGRECGREEPVREASGCAATRRS